MKQYITPSSIAFQLQTSLPLTSSTLTTSDDEVNESTLIQTQKKGVGIPWEDYMDYGQEEE